MARRSLLIFLFFNGVATFAQTYNFDNFTVEDGLAQSQIFSICQDLRGNLWFGTNGGGVSKYDGRKFTTYTVRDGLADNIVFSVIEDKKGNLWFGTDGGLSRFDGINFTNYYKKNGLNHNRVYEIFEDKDGILWLGTLKGINIIEQDGSATLTINSIMTFEKDSLLKITPVSCIFQDKFDNLWFGTTTHGAIRYNRDAKAGEFMSFSKGEGLMHNDVRTINEDASGIIWVGTLKGASQIINDEVINRSFTDIKDYKDYKESVTSSVLDRDGNLWFTTYASGVFRYDSENFKRYNNDNGLISNVIWSALCDREGNLWFGSFDNGVSKFRGETFVNYSEKDGLANNYVQCVYEDSKGDFWIGSNSAGVSKIRGSTIDSIKIYGRLENSFPAFHAYSYKTGESSTIAHNNISAIIEDTKGNLWFGTRAEGVSKFDGTHFINYNEDDGLTANTVNAIIEDKKGVIWLGTKNGVTIIDGDGFRHFQAEDKLIGNDIVWKIFEDKEGDIWFATEKGTAKYSDGHIRHFTKKDGFVDDRVRSVIQDKQGFLWFSTSSGVYKYNPSTGGSESFETINDTMGLSSNTVYIILFDERKNLYIGTEKGIDILNVELYNKTKEISIKHYGKKEGFIGLECNNNAGFRDSKGNLWFGTVNGVTIFNPQLEKPNMVKPLTNINNIRLFFEDFNWKSFSDGIDTGTGLPAGLTLPYTHNHLTFDFTGVCLTIPEKVKYKFQLEGLDKDWFSETFKNEAVYSNIPEGKYTFKVMAMNNDGLWNEEPATFDFVILPPWYRTWWFYSGSVLLLLTAIYSVIVFRERNLRKKKLQLEKKVRERTKQVVEQKEVIEKKNKDITDSINYAEKIQRATLPPLSSIAEKFRDSFLTYAPRDIISGDFYWYADKNGRAFIASCDCTGHGVPGAMVSMIGNNLLDQIILEKDIDRPGEILSMLNKGMKSVFTQKGEQEAQDGMDMTLCAIDLEKNILEFAGARNSLYLIRNRELIETKGDKTPIGGNTKRDYEFKNHIIQVLKDDSLYLLSDGYTDQFGGESDINGFGEGKKFMKKRLKKLLTDIQDKSMNEQKEILRKTFNDWRGNQEQVDDVLIVGIKI